MFFVLSKLLDLFLSPLTWGVALLALGVPWRARSARRSRSVLRRRRLVAIAGLVVLWLASTHVVQNALVLRLEESAPATYDPSARYDAVVVLGGLTDERVTAERNTPAINENVERILVGYELLRDGVAKTAIVSGGAVDPLLADASEGRVLGRMLRGFGIADDRIIVEDKAMNTRENARFVADIVRAKGFGRVVVVTSAFHMPRAVECFRAVGIPFDTLPADFRGARSERIEVQTLVPRAQHLAATTFWVREIFGRLVYRVVGYGA